jgi:hypothetical protein
MPTDAAAAPPLAPDDGEELLRQVLAQGFESNDTNPQVKRKLLETVFSACIFTPIIESHTLDKERAELALSILDRQLPKLPEVLLEPCEASGPGPAAAPLYAWLMSRIVIAMTHSEDFEGLRGFVEPLCESAVRILGVLGRDLPNGRPRFATVLRELRQYGEGELEFFLQSIADNAETKSTLLEYSDVGGTSDPLPQLFALHIALQTAGPYAADQQQALAVAIAQLARKFTHLSPTRQQRYAAVLSAAIGVLPVSHVLSDAVTVVARWPHVDDDRWHESVTGLLRSVDKENDTSLQRDVWLALYPQHSRLQLESPLARQKILLLLNPALPRSIGSMLSAEALDQWSAQSTGTDKDNADIRERLRLYCDMPHTSSLKRKRHDKDTDEALQMMRRTFPDLDRDILDKEEGMKQ